MTRHLIAGITLAAIATLGPVMPAVAQPAAVTATRAVASAVPAPLARTVRQERLPADMREALESGRVFVGLRMR